MVRPDEECFVLDALGGDPHELLLVGWPFGHFHLTALVLWIERLFVGAGKMGCLYAFHPALYELGPRLLSALADTFAALFVGLTVRRLTKCNSGLLLGILAYGFNYLAIREAHFGVSNAAVNLGISAVLWAAVSGRRYLRAALVGSSFALKYSALPALVFAGPLSALAFFTLSPEALFHPRDFVTGLLRLNSKYTAIGSDGGYLPGHEHLIGWKFHLFTNLPIALGWPAYILAAVGLCLLTHKRQWAIPVYVAAALAVLLPVHQLFTRYADPLCVGLAIATAVALCEMRNLPWEWQAFALCFVFAAPVTTALEFDNFLTKPDTRDLAREWLIRHGGNALSPYGLARVPLIEPQWAKACGETGPLALTIDNGPPYWPTTERLEVMDAAYKGGGPVDKTDWVFVGTQVMPNGRYKDEEFQIQGNCFELVDTIDPGTPEAASIFDPFDMFFVPYRGFEGQHNPGPRVAIYRNRCK